MYTPEQILEKLWLSKKERVLYLLCLEYGWMTVTALQRRTQFPRTTIYDTLQKLEFSSYITKNKKNNTLIFYAVSIQEIMVLMEDKIILYEKRKALLKNNIPQFQQMIKWSHIIPSIKVYEWKDALSLIFWQIKNTQTVRTIFSAQASADFLSEQIITDVHNAHEFNRIQKKILLVDEPIATTEKKKFEKQWFDVRILPSWHQLYTDFIILDEKLFFLVYWKNLQAIEIDHEIILNSHREIFEMLRSFLT